MTKLKRIAAITWSVMIAVALTFGAVQALRTATVDPCGTHPWQIVGICPDEDECLKVCFDRFGGGGGCLPDDCCECKI